jgi:hypothetical protein
MRYAPGIMDDATKGPLGELGLVLGELDTLLKNPDVGAALAERGVNISLALVGVEGLRAYLAGEKERAAEEFSTLAEEVTARLAVARELARDKPS